jgi:hypothetical protein
MAINNPLPWRTGQHPKDEPGPRGRTIYDANNELIGVMDSGELAQRVVEAVNWHDSFFRVEDKVPE